MRLLSAPPQGGLDLHEVGLRADVAQASGGHPQMADRALGSLWRMLSRGTGAR
jgi:hypothetical protein